MRTTRASAFRLHAHDGKTPLQPSLHGSAANSGSAAGAGKNAGLVAEPTLLLVMITYGAILPDAVSCA